MSQEINSQDEEVLDEADLDESVTPERYDITSYGADYDVEGLVRRMNRDEIFIPWFQREFVWTMADASRFIESLLLGLPVPGIFLAKEQETNRLLVIDGQQRLKTLQFFYGGYFNPNEEKKTQRVFKLVRVQQKFENLTYSELDESDRIKLDNSIIHATVIKQESPDDNDTSVFHVFERLNSGGRKLNAQEIRVALFHGAFLDLINGLNESDNWRNIYGRVSGRLKDKELILRFLAMYFDFENYHKPMVDFLNVFAKKHRNPPQSFINECSELFLDSCDLIYRSMGKKAFRPERTFNAAVFDSAMVGLAKRISFGSIPDATSVNYAYSELLKNPDYQKATSYSTADETFVHLRMLTAIEAFSSI